MFEDHKKQTLAREDLSKKSKIPLNTIKNIEMGEEDFRTTLLSIPDISKVIKLDSKTLVNILLKWAL